MQNAQSVQTVWKNCLSRLRPLLNEEDYSTWFSPIKPLNFDGRTIVVQVPSQFMYEYIEENYVQQLREALHSAIGPEARLSYSALVDSTAPSMASRSVSLPSSDKAILPVDKARTPTVEAGKPKPFDSQLNPRFSFNSFYESHCNRVALSMAKTIAANPGRVPMNPFFLFGASGVGKTHLCHAIGLQAKSENPDLKVLYVSSSLFEMQFTSAARNGTLNSFINFYQQIDLLIIDDMQGLIGKTKTQQAFFQVFNHLYLLGKQMVMTSDKPPVELSGMEGRLVSRISGGLTLEIERPDLELRRAVLRHMMCENGVVLDDDVVEYVACNVKDGVRELEGTLISLITYSMVEGHAIDLPFTRSIVRRTVKVETQEITVERIRTVVCKVFEVSADDVRAKSRKQEVTIARQVIMALAKKYSGQSLSAIGEMLGGRSHTTVIHGAKTVANLMDVNTELRFMVEKCKSTLGIES